MFTSNISYKYKAIYLEALLALAGSLLIALFAQISIPLNPVPITLHTVAVMLLGYCLSPKRTVYATTLYILLGAAGFPVFSELSAGARVLVGTSGGYVVGFVPAAWLLARIHNKSDGLFRMALSGALATGVIFACGVCWLSTFTGFEDAIRFGVMPFILPGMCKVALLVCLLRAVRLAWK